MPSIVRAALWLGFIVGVYILGYLLNKKTPKPKGCEDLTADCGACQLVDCTHNPAHHKEEIEG